MKEENLGSCTGFCLLVFVNALVQSGLHSPLFGVGWGRYQGNCREGSVRKKKSSQCGHGSWVWVRGTKEREGKGTRNERVERKEERSEG